MVVGDIALLLFRTRNTFIEAGVTREDDGENDDDLRRHDSEPAMVIEKIIDSDLSEDLLKQSTFELENDSACAQHDEKDLRCPEQNLKLRELGEPEREPSVDSESADDEIDIPRWSRQVTEERWPDECAFDFEKHWHFTSVCVDMPVRQEAQSSLISAVEQVSEVEGDFWKVMSKERSSFRWADLSEPDSMVSEISGGEPTDNASISPTEGGDQLEKKPKRGCRRKILTNKATKQQVLPAKSKMRSGAPIFVPRALTETTKAGNSDTKVCPQCGSCCPKFFNFCSICGSSFDLSRPRGTLLSDKPSSKTSSANSEANSHDAGRASSKPAFMLRMIQ